MILDSNVLFSDAQAITASAASTNVIDLGATGKTAYGQVQLVRNLGKGGEIPLLIQVVETFAGCTSVTAIVQTDDNSAFSSPKDIQALTVPLAELKKGYIFCDDDLPRGIKERYLRIYFTVVGGPASAGKITAGIVGAVDGSYVG